MSLLKQQLFAVSSDGSKLFTCGHWDLSFKVYFYLNRLHQHQMVYY